MENQRISFWILHFRKGVYPVNNRLITKPKPLTSKPTPLSARINQPATRPVAKSEGLYDFRYKDNSKADNTSRVSPQPREKGSRTVTPPNKVSPSPKSDIWYEVPPINGSAQLGSPRPSFSRTPSALSEDLFSLTVSTPRVTPLPTTPIPSISNYEEPRGKHYSPWSMILRITGWMSMGYI